MTAKVKQAARLIESNQFIDPRASGRAATGDGGLIANIMCQSRWNIGSGDYMLMVLKYEFLEQAMNTEEPRLQQKSRSTQAGTSNGLESRSRYKRDVFENPTERVIKTCRMWTRIKATQSKR